MLRKLLLITSLFALGLSLNAQQLNWSWTRSIGGTLEELRPIVVTATNGDLVVGLSYYSPSVNVIGATTLPNGGSLDFLVARISSSGTLLWAKHFAAAGLCELYDLVLAPNGDIVITGALDGTLDFGGGATLASGGSQDAFLARLTSSGNHIWSKKMGNSATDRGIGLGMDPSDNIYLVGNFEGGTNFSSDALTVNFFSTPTHFIAKYNSLGATQWLNRIIGSNFVFNNLQVSPAGTVYVGVTMHPSMGSSLISFNENANVINANISGFVTNMAMGVLNSSGGFVLQQVFPGGSSRASGRRLFLSPGGDLFYAGVKGHLGGLPGALTDGAMIANSPANSFTEIATMGGASSYSDIILGPGGGFMGTGVFGGTSLFFPPLNITNASGELFFYGSRGDTGFVQTRTTTGTGTNLIPGRIAASPSLTQFYTAGSFNTPNAGAKIAFGPDTLRSLGQNDVFISGVSYSGLPFRASAGPDQTTCSGGTIQLNGSATGGVSPYSFAWTNLAGTSLGNQAGLTISPTAANSYVLTVTDNTGAIARDTVAVNIQSPPAPVVSPAGTVNLCVGDSLTLTTAAATSYLWSNGATTQSIKVFGAGSFSVKVKNAAGCESPFSAAVTVVSQPVPAAPTISPAGPIAICPGSIISLNSSPGVSYFWSNGSTTQGISIAAAGSYSVVITNAAGCLSPRSLPVVVSLQTAPATPVITAGGPTTFCPGDSVTLTSSSAPGYLWSNGATTQSIKVFASGIFTVKARNGNGCESTASAPVTVTANPQPDPPVISAGSPATFCPGDSVILSTAPAASYLWSNGAITPTIKVFGAGSFTVRVKNSFGCESVISAPFNTGLHPLPATPVISQTGNQLTCTPAASYQWFNNGVAIPGATGPGITISAVGLYSVTVTNAQGCKASSAPFQSVRMITTPHFDYQLYPNPVVGNLQLSFYLREAGTVNISLVSISGSRSLVLVNNQPMQPGAYQYRVPRVAQNLGKGIFLLRMQWNGETVAQRVLVQ